MLLRKGRLQITGYSRKSIQEFKSVTDKISSMRMEDLSFNHHQAVAPLPPEEQKHFLQKASEEKLSDLILTVLLTYKKIENKFV